MASNRSMDELSGGVVFAGVMILLSGLMNVVHGLIALSKGTFFVAGAYFVFGNLKTWGWILLILGVLKFVTGFAIFDGRDWARWFGIFFVAVNIVLQMIFMPTYPFWSLVMIFIDVVIIYALAVHVPSETAGMGETRT